MISAFCMKIPKQEHTTLFAIFGKRKIAEFISDFVVGVTGIEPAAS